MSSTSMDSAVEVKPDLLITHIRATDITIRLRHIPVGFYTMIETENGTKRTSTRPASVGKETVSWDDEIMLPSDRSSSISLTVFASFELGPALGVGEALGKFETTVGELLGHYEQHGPIKVVERVDEGADSSRSSLEIKIGWRVYVQNEYTDTSNLPESEEICRLACLTDMGHHALSRYRECQEQRDLDESIRHFEHARDLCPLNHPIRAAVLFNLATAELIYCRVNDVSPNLDIPINLYRDVLRLRPCGHPDHPFTLLCLGVALQARFQRRCDDADRTEGTSFLSHVIDHTLPDSYAYHAAVVALGSMAKRELIQPTEIPCTDNDLRSKGEVHRLDAALQWIFHPDSWKHVLLDHLGILFCIRFDRLGDLGDPEKAISALEVIVQFTSDEHPQKISWVDDLSILLWTRYERFRNRADLEKSLSTFEVALRLTPDSHPDKPLRYTFLGSSLSTRYRHFGDTTDLERSISLREDALRLTPDGHSDKPAQLNNLGGSLSTRYKRFGNIVDLHRSISLREDALQITPDGHPDKPLLLNNLSNSLSTRYECLGDIVDLERSISLTKDALQITLDDHPNKPLWLNDLGSLLLTRYERFGGTADLENSIRAFEEALQSTPDDHLDKPARLSSLGSCLSTRYERFGDVTDLERSLSLKEDALRITPDEHPDKPLRLNNLGCSLFARYEHLGDIVDLERSISLTKDALQATPDSHLHKSLWRSNLGRLLLTRYERFRDIVDLERSISLLEDAVQFTSNSHPDKPSRLNNLGNSLLARYERFGDIINLERSIFLFEDAVRRTPENHPDKSARFHNLGLSLLARYRRIGDVVNLDRSISLFEDAVQSTANGHPAKLTRLSNLGNSLSARYERFGNEVDLERSISLFRDVLRLTHDRHPDKPAQLNDLGNLLLTRYERSGGIVDLEESISLRESAVRLTSNGHPDKSSQLNNLSHSLSIRYKQSGDIADLERSISVSEDALQLSLDGDPVRLASLNNLGRLLTTRYKRFGDIVDLERSISLCEDGLHLTPNGHPHMPSRLDTLGYLLLTRYEHLGDVMDLERSISLRQDAVQSTPDGHQDKLLWLNNLSRSLSGRYERFGDIADLERSILVLENAVHLTPDGCTNKPGRLNNLGGSLSARYERFREVPDLERSISLLQGALRLIPDSHPDKPAQLNNLGHLLLTRYERFGDATDLERSISLFEDIVQSTVDGHPEKPLRLSNLGSSLSTRYNSFGDIVDLEKSISSFEDALRLTPDDHLDKPSRLNHLAVSFIQRAVFQSSNNLSTSDLSQAIQHSSRAACSLTGPIVERFRASRIWVRCIHILRRDSQSLLDAYAAAVGLLPQLAWMGLSLHDRYHRLLQAANTVCDAVAAALNTHRPGVAIEWLEQGRTIVWSQLLQLRTSVDDLRTMYPELAAQFECVSRELEHSSARGRGVVTSSADDTTIMDGLLEKQAQQHHVLALSRERLLAEIRALPGFERFLLPKTIEQLCRLAHSGPVVFLNASKYRCDALVVMADSEHVVHVPLSNTDYDEVESMRLQLGKVLSLEGRVTLRDDSDRGARVKGMTSDDVFRSILTYLWEKIASPILDVLTLSTLGSKLPRIFWCPTGPFSFLPIHAAGLYCPTNPGPKLSDFAISSYIPMMSALELLPRDSLKATSRNIRLLAVPQPSTDGQTHLGGVRGEIGAIRKLASLSSFVGLREADGTVEDVLLKMADADWVHFACHAAQDRANPFDSGLLLAYGRRLKLPDIARLSRPHGGLAFLSACHTATGDEQLSEETIHIAAGMLLAGYRGVIATMWSILDRDAPKVAEDVYGSLFGDGKVPDSRQAAEALHDAVERLRNSGVSFLSWVPFIHVGL